MSLFLLPAPITANELRKFDEDQLSNVFNNQNNICRRIDASVLLELSDKIDFSAISSGCLYGLQGFSGPDAIDLGEMVDKLPKTAFELAFKNLNPGTISRITASQAENISPPVGYCKHGVDISSFSQECLFAVPARCVAESIEENPTKLSTLNNPQFLNLIKGKATESWDSKIHDDICSNISITKMLQYKQKGIDTVDILPDECWRVMIGLYDDAEDLSSLIEFIRPTVLKKVKEGLHPNTSKSLTQNFAETFATESIYFCTSATVNEFSTDFLLNLNIECASQIVSQEIDKGELDCHILITLYSRVHQVNNNVDINPASFRNNCKVLDLFEELDLESADLLGKMLLKDIEVWPNISFCSLTSFNDISQMTFKNSNVFVISSIPPFCITSMKEFRRGSAVLGPLYPVLPVNVFESLPSRFEIGEKNMEDMPEEFVKNFAKKTPSLCNDIDLTPFGQKVILINVDCLKNSLKWHHNLFSVLSKDTLVEMTKLDPTLCEIFQFNELLDVLGEENIDSNYECLLNSNDFVKNISHLAPKLAPHHFSSMKIPPTSELIISVGYERARYWADKEPKVCKKAHDIQPELLSQLSEMCQSYYWKSKHGVPLLESIPVKVFQHFLKWKKYKGFPVEFILEAGEQYQEVTHPVDLLQFDLTAFSRGKQYSFVGFRDDILSSIPRPLDLHLIKCIEPSQINGKVCSLYYAKDLPSEANPTTECRVQMQLLQELFPDRDYWYSSFWSDVEEILKTPDIALERVQSFENLLKQGLEGQGHAFQAYKFINDILVDFWAVELRLAHDKIAEVSKTLRNLGFNTISELILNFESFTKVIKRPLNPYKSIEIGKNHREGQIYPIFLFTLVEEKGAVFAGSRTQVFNNQGNDAGAVSRNLIDQCIDFIFNGPSKEIKEIEIAEKTKKVDDEDKVIDDHEAIAHYRSYRWSRPVLREAFSNLKFTFFPFRASRKMGKFVAFTIAKAMRKKLLSLIDFPVEFYRNVAKAKPENELTEEEITHFNNYHDQVYFIKNIKKSVLEFLISEIHLYFDGDYKEGAKVENVLFPDLEVFDTPFGPPVEIGPSFVSDILDYGVCIESFTDKVTTKIEYDQYITDYQNSTYAEFRALLFEFKQVLNQAVDVEVFSSVWNPRWLQQITGDMNHSYTAQEIISAFAKNDYEIDSLVLNVKTDRVYKLTILRAFEMFVEELPQSLLAPFVAFFTGSQHYICEPNSFSISIKIGGTFKCKITSNESFEVLNSRKRAEIIEAIYKRELELFEVDPNEAKMVTSNEFYSIDAHNCPRIVDVNPETNQFQLIYALVQQLNEPAENIVH